MNRKNLLSIFGLGGLVNLWGERKEQEDEPKEYATFADLPNPKGQDGVYTVVGGKWDK